jgi:hypothetical protein
MRGGISFPICKPSDDQARQKISGQKSLEDRLVCESCRLRWGQREPCKISSPAQRFKKPLGFFHGREQIGIGKDYDFADGVQPL